MKITILTLFPNVLEPYFSSSIMRRAIEKGIVEYKLVNFRDFATGSYNKVDDIPYGGGAGMLLMSEPLDKALESVGAKEKKVIVTSAKGRLYSQDDAKRLAKEDELVIVAGHYEGIDERIVKLYSAEEYSIGDYVLTGGEAASIVIIDSVFRLIDDVIRKESLEEESYESNLLEYPQYTRPETYCSLSVPDVLLSGHHRHIAEWRDDKRLENTMLNRPDLLRDASLSIEMRRKLIKLIGKQKD